MKNLRYVVMVLALVNASLVAQAAAAHHNKSIALGSSTGKSVSTIVHYATGTNHGSE